MRVVVQRVSSAGVTVAGERVATIGNGLLLLVGIGRGDTPADVDAAVSKISGLRVFGDEENRMNLALAEVGGEILVVSQFTLLGDVARGRRPSFTGAADPEVADALITRMVDRLGDAGLRASSGVFGARMEVDLVNNGPVTLVIEVKDGKVAGAEHL